MTEHEYSDDFFRTEGVTYLNCAYHGAVPRVAAAAAEKALELKMRPHLIRDEYHFDFPDAYRSAVAELIGASPDSIALTDSTTHAMMILVQGLDWQSGDEVIIPRGAFPANRFPWRSLEAKGVSIREVDLADPRAALSSIEQALTSRTRLVSVGWVSYSRGTKLDLAEVGKLCRRAGVLFVVDASQGLGGLHFRLEETPCDLLACSGYKWLLGPYGLGFAYVAPDLCERLSTGNINWFAIEGARNFNRLSECELKFVPGARRFDINEPANFLNTATGTASLRYLLEVGVPAVERHNQGLIDRLVRGLPSSIRPVSTTEPAHRSNILCLSAGSASATAEVSERLAQRGIVVSHREDALRVSPHLYNTEADIDLFLDTVASSGQRR